MEKRCQTLKTENRGDLLPNLIVQKKRALFVTQSLANRKEREKLWILSASTQESEKTEPTEEGA